jgi:hypothetical protein
MRFAHKTWPRPPQGGVVSLDTSYYGTPANPTAEFGAFPFPLSSPPHHTVTRANQRGKRHGRSEIGTNLTFIRA